MATPASQSVFGNPNVGFTNNSASLGNNDQMNMEDSMAEDTVQGSMPTVQGSMPTVQGSMPTVPVFGQSSFVFGSTAPSTGNPFQFGAQQNPSPFQASNSLGGSFSVGAGGDDKSNRKYVKVNRNKAGRRK
jgi:hypothetical protein